MRLHVPSHAYVLSLSTHSYAYFVSLPDISGLVLLFWCRKAIPYQDPGRFYFDKIHNHTLHTGRQALNNVGLESHSTIGFPLGGYDLLLALCMPRSVSQTSSYVSRVELWILTIAPTYCSLKVTCLENNWRPESGDAACVQWCKTSLSHLILVANAPDRICFLSAPLVRPPL